MEERYSFVRGSSPLVATAIHDGHQVRAELMPWFNLDDAARLREEDPFTSRWVHVADNQVVVHHSRFETDVNRPRDKAVYLKPEDAWGLQVWKNGFPESIAEASLGYYDEFYRQAKKYFDDLFTQHDHLIVFDIHSYNHRRDGASTFADPAENPEINIGTKNMDPRWSPLIHELIHQLYTFDYNGRHLDVRENVKFKGGYFGQWLFEQYGPKVCPVSIEFKKFFMNEWTGEAFDEEIDRIHSLLQHSKQAVLNKLQEIKT